MDLVELKAHDFYRHIISCGMLFLMDLVELKEGKIYRHAWELLGFRF